MVESVSYIMDHSVFVGVCLNASASVEIRDLCRAPQLPRTRQSFLSDKTNIRELK